MTQTETTKNTILIVLVTICAVALLWYLLENVYVWKSEVTIHDFWLHKDTINIMGDKYIALLSSMGPIIFWLELPKDLCEKVLSNVNLTVVCQCPVRYDYVCFLCYKVFHWIDPEKDPFTFRDACVYRQVDLAHCNCTIVKKST